MNLRDFFPKMCNLTPLQLGTEEQSGSLCMFIPSDTFTVKPNAKYLKHFLVVLKKVLKEKPSL